MTKIPDSKVPDYSKMKTSDDVAKALKDIKTQAGNGQTVSKNQLAAFQSQVDKMGLGNIKYSLNGNPNTIDDSLQLMANTVDPAKGAGQSLNNAIWGAKLDGMIAEMSNEQDVAQQQKDAATQTATSGPSSTGAMPTPTSAEALRAQYANATPPLSDKESVFKRVNNKLGEDIKAGASEAQIKQDIADCYSAYNDKVGDNGKRNWNDFQKHLGEQFAKSATPEAAKNWSDWSNQLFSSSATQYVGYKPPATGDTGNDGSDYVGTDTV